MAARYFADSFYWIALANPKDAFHGPALVWEASHVGATLITTEEVLAEVLTWFAGAGPSGRGQAAKTVRDILSDATCQVLPHTSADFHAALGLYEARPDKSYSLVDCRSMLALKALGISEVLTNDHHFVQEGFNIVFP